MSRVIARLNRRRRRRNLGVLWAAQFLNTAGLMMLVPVMPLHMAELGVADAEVGLWAGLGIAAPALPLAIITPLWGRLGDRVGRKWMVVRALVGLAAAMAVMAAATSAAVFVAGRLLQGSVGGVVEAAAGFVGADDEDEGRGSRLGRSFSATAAGALAGPLAGGVFVGSNGLRALMLAIATLAAVLGLLCTVVLREARNQPATAGPTVGPRCGPTGLRRAVHALGPGTLLAASAAYFGMYGLIPVYAEHVALLVEDPRSTGLWVGGLHAIMWAGTLVASSWWGRRNDRNGHPVRTLALASAVGALAILAQVWPLHVAALIPLRLVQGFCFAALAQSLFLHASRVAAADQRATYVGTANSALLAGQFAGPLAAGASLAVLPPPVAVLATALVVGLAAVIARAAAPHVDAADAVRPGGRGTWDVTPTGRHRASGTTSRRRVAATASATNLRSPSAARPHVQAGSRR